MWLWGWTSTHIPNLSGRDLRHSKSGYIGVVAGVEAHAAKGLMSLEDALKLGYEYIGHKDKL